ncbi:MAG TPA: hypothetical protein VHX92_02030, partial [Rhizomicrobium sp.]|nr:hypothetical protein [Rhizomicrobium sp.]
MTTNASGLLETPGSARHIWRLGWESSAWYVRAFALLVVLSLVFERAYGFLSGHGILVIPNFDYWSDKVFILVGFFVLLLGVAWREYNVARKERYANIFDRLEVISASLRDLNTYLNSKEAREKIKVDADQFQKTVRRELETILDNAASLFSMVTGTTCRAALKCTFIDNDEVFVYAITRDTASNRYNVSTDKMRFEARADKVKDNEDFYSVFTEGKRWYVERDLSTKRQYKNSSFDYYGQPPVQLHWFFRIFDPSHGWTLPYKSTMVFPVQQQESGTLSVGQGACVGFLAIDSAFRGVFKPRFDCPLGAT